MLENKRKEFFFSMVEELLSDNFGDDYSFVNSFESDDFFICSYKGSNLYFNIDACCKEINGIDFFCLIFHSYKSEIKHSSYESFSDVYFKYYFKDSDLLKFFTYCKVPSSCSYDWFVYLLSEKKSFFNDFIKFYSTRDSQGELGVGNDSFIIVGKEFNLDLYFLSESKNSECFDKDLIGEEVF